MKTRELEDDLIVISLSYLEIYIFGVHVIPEHI